MEAGKEIVVKSRILLGGTALLLGTAANAWADQNSSADLQKQIQELQAQVSELQAQRAIAPAYSASDVNSVVDSVLKDAERRSQLLADGGGGFLGGWENGKFTIRSADGNYSLSPGIWLQFRSVTNVNDRSGGEGGNNLDNGFELRRLKLSFEGNAITKDLTYGIVWATDRKNGNLVNEEAWARYAFADNWAVKVGQYKELIYQETATSSKRKLAVDVSLAGQILFGGDTYSQGIELDYGDHDEALRALVGISDGYGSVNTNFQDPPANPFDFGVYGRVEYKLLGDWKSYTDATALGNKHDLLVIGAGGDWSQNGDQSIYRPAIDLQWETGPFGVFAGLIGRYTDSNSGSSTFDWGAVAQLGYLINSRWEIFGRYDLLKLDNVAAGKEDTFHELTLGVNYYLKGHNAKVTFDGGWLPNGSPSNADAIGVLSNNGENEFYIRGQFQLVL
jgi:hypothetical protein